MRRRPQVKDPQSLHVVLSGVVYDAVTEAARKERSNNAIVVETILRAHFGLPSLESEQAEEGSKGGEYSRSESSLASLVADRHV